MKNRMVWMVWLAGTVLVAGYFTYKLLLDEDKTVFLPGKTSHGHYQIELACKACHTTSFTDADEMQKSCMNCHGTELKLADDKHPKSKFTNPRNADRVAKLDARYCVTCHGEHKPEVTGPMGLTMQADICIVCHKDIAEDRPSHAGMEFTTCASAGCHNFHDNRALYEDFLLKHTDENKTLESPRNKLKNYLARIDLISTYPVKSYPVKALSSEDKDMPVNINPDQKIIEQWSNTAHARSGVNCTACHNVKDKQGKVAWVNKPTEKTCQSCHGIETDGFLAGKHGMRLAQDLSPMKPEMARSSMKSLAHGKQLSCVSCHSSHEFDTRHAATEACMQCHDDRHTQAYKDSSHFKLWMAESGSDSKENNGVSCASCHMPRVETQFPDSSKHVVVQHNQNDNLRPNEKMIRSVCMNCHGLAFSIDALADRDLINKNFTGSPAVHINSIDMAKQRVKNKQKSTH